MLIYKFEPRFDEKTGKKKEEITVTKELRCDFSGKICRTHEENEHVPTEYKPYPAYCLSYNMMDPCYGSGGPEYEFGQKYDINMHRFLSESYAFRGQGGQQELIEDIFQRNFNSFHKKRKDWFTDRNDQLHSFAAVFRIVRCSTAEHLINKDVVEPKQLTGHISHGV